MSEAFESLVAEIGADLSGLKKGVSDGDSILSKLGQGAKATGLDGFTRDINGKLHDSMGRFVKETEAGFSGLAGTIRGSFSSISSAMLPVTGLLAGIGTAALAASSDVGKGFREIRIRTGETGEALAALQGNLKNVFSTIPTSAKEAGQALAILHTRTSETGSGLELLTKQELELARMTGGDLASQLNNTTRLFGDWSIKTGETSAAMDTLFRVSQQTGVGVDRLSQLMVQFGAPLRSLGFGFSEAAALLGKFEKEGVNTELVMGSLRIALGKMAKEGIKDPTEAFKVLTERIKNARSEGEATTLAFELFGRRAGVDMAKAIREGRFSIDDLIQSVKNSKDTILGASEDTRTFGESMTILKNKVELALQPLGKSMTQSMKDLLPLLESGVGWIAKLADGFNAMDPASKKVVGGLVAVIGGVGPLAFVFSGLTRAISDTYGAFASVVRYVPTVVNALASVNIATAAATAGWIGLAGAAIYAMAKIAEGQKNADVGGPVAGQAVIAAGGAGQNRVTNGLIDWVFGTKAAQQAKEKGADIGAAATEGISLGVQAGVQTVDAANKKALADIGRLGAGHAKKAAGEMAKALVDGFQDGIEGLQKASDLIASKAGTGGLAALFDPMSKGARKNAEEIKNALKAGTAAINDYLSEHGHMAKITEARLASMADRGQLSLLKLAIEFKKAKEAARDLAVDILAFVPGASKEFEAAMGRLKSSTIEVVPPIKGLQTAIKDSKSLENDLIDEAADKWGDYQQAVYDANQRAKQAVIDAAKVEHDALLTTFEDVSHSIPEVWNNMIDGIVNGSGRLGDSVLKLAIKIKGWAGDIIGVVDTIPGHFGDAARKVLKTTEDWFAFANKVLGILHRLSADIPGSIGDIAEKIAGISKSATQQVQVSATGQIDAIGMINDALKKDANNWQVWNEDITTITGKTTQAVKSNLDGLKGALAAAGVGLTGFLGGLGIGQASGSRLTGAIGGGISGAFSGALLGMKIGAAGGPIGLLGGALIGGAAGIIGGLLGGGKSELQKAQESAALQQARDAIKISQQSVLKATEEAKQSLLNTVAKVREIFESLRFYDRIGSPAIKAFFKDLSVFMKQLAKEAENWVAFAKTDIKAAAESLSAGVGLISQLPAILSAIGTHFKVGEAQMDVFFADADSFFEKLGAFVSEIPKKIQKQIGKFGERTGAGIEVFSPLIDVIRGITDIKEVPDENFNIAERALDKIVTKLGGMGERFAKSFQKVVSFFAQNVSPGVELWGKTVTVIRDSINVPQLSEQDANNTIGGMELFLNTLVARLGNMETSGLVKITAIVGVISTVGSSLKSWAEGSEAVRGYVAIGADTWEVIGQDFKKALQFFDLWILDATLWTQKAKTLEDIIKEGASHVASAASLIGSALTNMASAMGGTIGNLQGGSVGAASFGGSFAASSLSPSFAGTGFAAAPPGASGSAPIEFHFHGPVSSESGARDMVLRAWESLANAGLVPKIDKIVTK